MVSKGRLDVITICRVVWDSMSNLSADKKLNITLHSENFSSNDTSRSRRRFNGLTTNGKTNKFILLLFFCSKNVTNKWQLFGRPFHVGQRHSAQILQTNHDLFSYAH